MKLITATVRPASTQEVADSLTRSGFVEFTMCSTDGFLPFRRTERYRGRVFTSSTAPMIRVEALAEPGDAPRVARIIAAAAFSGVTGDGMVWTTDVGDVLRIEELLQETDALPWTTA